MKQTGASSGEVVGDLTMHGVTQSIILSVELLSGRWRVRTAPLRRSQFGLVFSKSAETVSMISDEVAIEIEISAERANQQAAGPIRSVAPSPGLGSWF